MAEHAPPTTADGAVEHADVRYEHSDVEERGVMLFVLGLVAVLIVLALIVWGLFFFLLDRDRGRKETTLPPAAVDAGTPVPGPRLEQSDDVRDGNVRLYPPRARDYLSPQEKLLEQGDAKAGAIKIDDALKELPGALKARSKMPPAAMRPPNQAASGRTVSEKGGP